MKKKFLIGEHNLEPTLNLTIIPDGLKQVLSVLLLPENIKKWETRINESRSSRTEISNISRVISILPDELKSQLREVFSEEISEEDFLQEVANILNVHEQLTETIPTTIIETEVKILGNGRYSGKLYNPGKTPNIERLGLAMSQVGACGMIQETELGENSERKKTPMVTQIQELQLSEDADQNFESENDFDLEVKFLEEKNILQGEVKLDGKIICTAEMILSFVPLMPKIIDRIRKKTPTVDFKKPEGEFLPDLQMPGFNNHFNITNRVRNEISDYGEIEVTEGLFQGHFPQTDIIPIAGSARPGFWIAENRLMDPDGNLMEVSKIKNLKIPAPLLPNDKLFYKITEIQDEENCVSIDIFYELNGEKKQAVSFEKVWLKPAKRKNNLWNHANVAEAFKNQDQIPEYTEHVNKVVQSVVDSVLTLCKEGDFQMIDIGTGASARIIKGVMEHKDMKNLNLELNITLNISDVAQSALEGAKKELVESFLDKKTKILTYFMQKAGKIIPENIAAQDIIVGNFSFYGDLAKSLSEAYEKLKSPEVLVLGLPHQNPNYNNLMIAESDRLKNSFDSSQYKSDLIMSDIGIDLCEDSLTHRKNCEYLPIEEVKGMLEKVGFKVEVIEASSFCGIGYIIKAYKK